MRSAISSLSTAAALCVLSCGLSFVFPGAALAQYDADLERPQVGSPNPEGRPPSYRAWAPLSYYIWRDGGGWHLRSTTSGHYHQFQGQVQAPEGVYNVRSTDPRTPLEISGNVISFNYSVQGGEKGFDWSGNGPMSFNLTVDGRDRSEKVRIGYAEQRPYPGGIQLYPGGGASEPMAMAPTGDSPPEDDTANMQSAEGPEVDPDSFQAVLSPYGQWVNDPEYGTIWRPYPQVVGPDYSPYSYGRWAYTDLGWTWVSGYDWGWAPFHYGNWVYTDGFWGWVPGRVWAPAWVSWRYGGGYVGWAPVAPYGHRTVVVEPGRYSYVTVGGFQSTGYYNREVIVTGPRAERIHGQTSELASASYVGGRAVVPVHAGPSPTVIGHDSGRPVVPVQASTLHAVGPPANQRGVHYAGGSASHPFAAKPMPQAVAKQYMGAQPKAAQTAFHEHVAATRGGVQPGHALPTAPAARAAPSERSGAAARPAMNERPAANGRPAANERSNANERPAMNERSNTNERPAVNERSNTNERQGPAEHESMGQAPQEGHGPSTQSHPAAKPAKPKPPVEKRR